MNIFLLFSNYKMHIQFIQQLLFITLTLLRLTAFCIFHIEYLDTTEVAQKKSKSLRENASSLL